MVYTMSSRSAKAVLRDSVSENKTTKSNVIIAISEWKPRLFTDRNMLEGGELEE